MAMSLKDVLSALRGGPDNMVNTSLTIHSQAQNQTEGYVNSVWFGHGALRYVSSSNVRSRLEPEHLATTSRPNQPPERKTYMKVLNDGTSLVDPATAGREGDQQSFLVQEPGAQYWAISIYPPFGIASRPPAPPPQPVPARITMTGPYANDSWSVDLTDDNAFLRGIGPDPIDASKKALYSIVFATTGIDDGGTPPGFIG